MDREDRTQFTIGPASLELADTLDRVELDVGRATPESRAHGLDGVGCCDRASGRFDRAADTVLAVLFMRRQIAPPAEMTPVTLPVPIVTNWSRPAPDTQQRSAKTPVLLRLRSVSSAYLSLS